MIYHDECGANRRFHVPSAHVPLSIETATGNVVVTRLGTFSERTQLGEMLNAEFRVASQPQTPGGLPPGWCEILSSERCQIPLDDRTTAEATARDFAEIKEQLAASGRWGHMALRVIERLQIGSGPGKDS